MALYSKIDSLRTPDAFSGGTRISQTGASNHEFVDKNLLFGKNFAKNCIKILKIDGEGHSRRPLNSPMHTGYRFSE